ncbi:cAMP-regulated phosphoprotein 21 [Gryganskiella cystojenkinii]|nr:cAMP-regulated phosphoprotein 21 [Gryganskiella cystojenkinii]
MAATSASTGAQGVPDQCASTMNDRGNTTLEHQRDKHEREQDSDSLGSESKSEVEESPPTSLISDELDEKTVTMLEQVEQCFRDMNVQETAPAVEECLQDSCARPLSSPPSSPLTLHPCCGPAESLDEFLLTALKNKQNRIFLLKLEREFCCYLESTSQQPLEFPWLNSYYRMMIHRSAIYFQLSRKVDPLNKRITLSKNSCSAIPVLRFSDLVEEEEEERTCQEEPVKSIRVLKRCPARPVSAFEPCPRTRPTSTDRRSITIEQREQDYAEARARIFKDEEGGEDTEGPCSLLTSSTSKVSLVRRSSATSCSSSGTGMTETSAGSEAGSSFTSSSSMSSAVTENGGQHPLNHRAKPFTQSKSTTSWPSPTGNTSCNNSSNNKYNNSFGRQVYSSEHHINTSRINMDRTWACTGHDCQCATCSRYSYRPHEYHHHHHHNHATHSHAPQQRVHSSLPTPGWSSSNHTQGMPYNPSRHTFQSSGCGTSGVGQALEYAGGGNTVPYYHSQSSGPPPSPAPPPLLQSGPAGYFHQAQSECPAWCETHQVYHDSPAFEGTRGSNNGSASHYSTISGSPAPLSMPVMPQSSAPPHLAPMTLTVRPYPSSNGYRPCRQGIDVFQQQHYHQQQHHPHGYHPPQQQHQYPGQQNIQYTGTPSPQHQHQQQQQQQQQQQPHTFHYQLRPQQHLQHSAQYRMSSHTRGPSHGSSQHQQQQQQQHRSSFETESQFSASPPHQLHHHPSHHHHHQQQQRTNKAGQGSGTQPRAVPQQGSNHRNQHSRNGSNSNRGCDRAVGVVRAVGGGPVVYDVDRRPPKSAELYDPYADKTTTSARSASSSSSSPSTSSSSSMGAQLDAARRQKSSVGKDVLIS